MKRTLWVALLAGPLVTWIILSRPPDVSSGGGSDWGSNGGSTDAVGPGMEAPDQGADPLVSGLQGSLHKQAPDRSITPAQQASPPAPSATASEREAIVSERVLMGTVIDGRGAPVVGAEVNLRSGVTVQGIGWVEGERMWQMTSDEQVALRHTQAIFSGAGFEVDMPDTWSSRELQPRGIVATTRTTEGGHFRIELPEDALDIPHSIMASRLVTSSRNPRGSIDNSGNEWQLPRAVGLWRTDLVPVRDLTPLSLEFFEPGQLITDVRIPAGLNSLPNSQAILTLDDIFVESVDLTSFANRESQAFLGLEPGRYTLRIEAGCGRWKVHEEAYDVLPGATTHTDPIKLGSALTLYRLELVNEYGRAPDPDILTVQDALTGKTHGNVPFDDPAGHLDLVVPNDLGALRLTTYTQGNLELTPALGVSALDAEVARHRKVTLRL